MQYNISYRRKLPQITDKCQPLLTPHQNLLFTNQVRRTIRLKHMSRRPEKSYIYYILDYIYFHNKKHPEDIGLEEIRSYLSYLATDKKVAASTQNIALSALLFLYRQVLKVDFPYIDKIERARRPT